MSCVKLVWIPLFENVLFCTVNEEIKAVSCACTSSARCGELLLNTAPLIIAAVVTAVPVISNRNESLQVMIFQVVEGATSHVHHGPCSRGVADVLVCCPRTR